AGRVQVQGHIRRTKTPEGILSNLTPTDKENRSGTGIHDLTSPVEESSGKRPIVLDLRATENPRIADRTIVHDFFLGFFPAQPHELFSDTSGSFVGRGSNPSGSDVGGVIVRGDLT